MVVRNALAESYLMSDDEVDENSLFFAVTFPSQSYGSNMMTLWSGFVDTLDEAIELIEADRSQSVS